MNRRTVGGIVRQRGGSRRALLSWSAGAGVVAGAALLTRRSPSTAIGQVSGLPIGSWQVDVQIQGQPPQKALHTYSPDGGVVTTLVPTAPPPPGAPRSSTAHGAWAGAGADGFVSALLSYLVAADGTFAGTLTVASTATLSDDGESFDATFTFESRNAAGDVLFAGSGSERGMRLAAQ